MSRASRRSWIGGVVVCGVAACGPDRTPAPSPELPISAASAPTASTASASSSPSASAAQSSAALPSASASAGEPPETGPVLELEGAAWSPDKKLVATLFEAHVHLWNGDTKALLRAFPDDSSANGVLFSADGKRLFVSHENNPPAVYDDPAGKEKLHYFDLPGGIHPESDRGTGMLALSDDGAWLLGRCSTVQICLWNTKNYRGRMWMRPDAGTELVSLGFEEGGKRIVGKGEAGEVYRLEVPSLRPVK